MNPPSVEIAAGPPGAADTRVRVPAMQSAQTVERGRAPFQDGVTVVTVIRPGQEAALIQILERIGADIEGNELIPFMRLKSVHFARFVVLEASQDATGRPTPASLLFSSNFDGDVAGHFAELYDRASGGLELIYSHCEGFPPAGRRSRDAVIGYLRKHDTGYNTLYCGTRGRTVQQIQDEARLRDRIEGFLDGAVRDPAFLEQTPEQIRASIQRFVVDQADLAWARESPPTPRRYWPHRRDVAPFAGIIAVLIGAVATWVNVGWLGRALVVLTPLAGVGLWLVTLRRREKTDEQFPAVTDFAHVKRLAQKEDRFVQNQMSAVNNVKPGMFRQGTLRVVLWAIDLTTRYIYTKGQLGSIPSIHFARWVLIDEGRRLVFFSNFDGSWENYLGDFIDKASTGLTAVWSNTFGFPRSRFLVNDGADDEQRFKAYARNSQVVTQVWYTAYKWLSVQNINNNSAIRAGLFAEQTPAETAAWLRRL